MVNANSRTAAQLCLSLVNLGVKACGMRFVMLLITHLGILHPTFGGPTTLLCHGALRCIMLYWMQTQVYLHLNSGSPTTIPCDCGKHL